MSEEAAAPTTAAAPSSSRFNPSVSVILSGTYASLQRSPDDWSLSGFQVGEDGHGVGPGERGFSLGESEISLRASVWTHTHVTGIDTATESLAYYPLQVEKFLARHETLVAERGEAADPHRATAAASTATASSPRPPSVAWPYPRTPPTRRSGT